MPRQRRGSDVIAPTALVASATRYPGNVTRIFRGYTDWQAEAWRHYDICGELRYAANWVGNVMSRSRLHAATQTANGVSDRSNATAKSAMEVLFGGAEGQSQMLSAFGIHLTVAGECYLIGRTVDGTDIWEVAGTQEVKQRGRNWGLDRGDGNIIKLADSDVVIRIWRPHPRKKIEADSPVRAVLPILTEIEYLTRHIFAQTTSRLAGAGIMQVPQGMTFPAPPADANLPVGASAADIFMAVLGEAMLTPIKDPGSPSAIVPIVVTVPDELVGKIELTTFWAPLDEHAVELRTEAIRRLALGLDMPPEVLLGTADINHWGSWQIEESSIKAHIEPGLDLIANAITTGYLQPLTDDTKDIVAFDTSSLRLRPNRSREAIELYDRGELDGEALRRETGFDEDDKPADDEFRLWLLRKVASGSSTPEQVQAALAELGVLLTPMLPQRPTREERPVPTLDEHPVRELPDREESERNNAAALIAAAEVLVFRALERAGNRLRATTKVRPPGVAAADIYRYVKPTSVDKALEDAWTCVPQVCKGLTCDVDSFTASLDSYVRALLTEQKEHNRDLMLSYFAMKEAVG